jgi:hypothetical protein
MYYTTKRYSLHGIGLSLQGGALIFPLWEIGRGHPLDQAGQSGPVYTLCFTQKITAANLNRAKKRYTGHQIFSYNTTTSYRVSGIYRYSFQTRAKLRPLIQHHNIL